jgi:cation diffusion facilitator CzcD-associated flavoprotein CzcO
MRSTERDRRWFMTGSIEHVETVIIGAGHAGLTMSYFLRQLGREHVILERGRVGERWRSERWDSFHFQFPNWTIEAHPDTNTNAKIQTPSRPAMSSSDSSKITRRTLRLRRVAEWKSLHWSH